MILSVDDLRQLAKRRIPRAIFDYAAGGSYEEQTLRRNSADLDAMTFRQRVMVDVSNIALATSMAGAPVSMPLAIGPTGLAGLFCADGEILAARALTEHNLYFYARLMAGMQAAIASRTWREFAAGTLARLKGERSAEE